MREKHKDILGHELDLNDIVVYSNHNSLNMGKIIKINPIMIKVEKIIPKSKYANSYNKYPKDVVKINQQEGLLYILKNL